MQFKTASCAAIAALSLGGVANADFVGVVGGQTSVLLDFELISSVTDLELTGVSDGVVLPGNLGDESVAFTITSRYAANDATDFLYDADDFIATFSGTIAHRGTLTFNESITIGNFDIAFDEGLGAFAVSDTFFDGTGLGALFAIGLPLTISPLEQTFDAVGDLLVTENFATILLDLGLTTVDLTGADVGDAFIQGYNQAIPGPGPLVLAAIAAAGARRRRR